MFKLVKYLLVGGWLNKCGNRILYDVFNLNKLDF